MHAGAAGRSVRRRSRCEGTRRARRWESICLARQLLGASCSASRAKARLEVLRKQSVATAASPRLMRISSVRDHAANNTTAVPKFESRRDLNWHSGCPTNLASLDNAKRPLLYGSSSRLAASERGIRKAARSLMTSPTFARLNGNIVNERDPWLLFGGVLGKRSCQRLRTLDRDRRLAALKRGCEGARHPQWHWS